LTFRRLILLLFSCLGWHAPPAAAQAFTEYQLKAGVLYNFIAFTAWPEPAPRVLNLCLYGADSFSREIDALHGRRVGNSALAIRRASSVESLESCQVVFVSQGAIGNLLRVAEQLEERPVLLVVEAAGAIPFGAILSMEIVQGKLAFKANLGEARRRSLTLSSKLLRLASEVVQ